jgi:hypothetical protein
MEHLIVEVVAAVQVRLEQRALLVLALVVMVLHLQLQVILLLMQEVVEVAY